MGNIVDYMTRKYILIAMVLLLTNVMGLKTGPLLFISDKKRKLYSMAFIFIYLNKEKLRDQNEAK